MDTADAWTETYSAPAPILIAGDSEMARERASRTVSASGLRIADRVSLDQASSRIDLQVSASAVWIELDEDGGAPMDVLLRRINDDAASGRYAAIVSTPIGMLDPVAAWLTDPSVELLIDGNEANRAAALAIALSGAAKSLVRCRRRPQQRTIASAER